MIVANLAVAVVLGNFLILLYISACLLTICAAGSRPANDAPRYALLLPPIYLCTMVCVFLLVRSLSPLHLRESICSFCLTYCVSGAMYPPGCPELPAQLFPFISCAYMCEAYEKEH